MTAGWGCCYHQFQDTLSTLTCECENACCVCCSPWKVVFAVILVTTYRVCRCARVSADTIASACTANRHSLQKLDVGWACRPDVMSTALRNLRRCSKLTSLDLSGHPNLVDLHPLLELPRLKRLALKGGLHCAKGTKSDRLRHDAPFHAFICSQAARVSQTYPLVLSRLSHRSTCLVCTFRLPSWHGY